MGEGTQAVLKLSCEGCGTSFRLTPRKDRLPRNPIPCPKCGADISCEVSTDAKDSEEARPPSDGNITRIPGVTDDGETARVPALKGSSDDGSGGEADSRPGTHTLLGAPVSVDSTRGFSRANAATRVGSSSRLRSLSKVGGGGLGEDRSSDSREFGRLDAPEVSEGDDSPGLRRQVPSRAEQKTAQQPALSGSEALDGDSSGATDRDTRPNNAASAFSKAPDKGQARDKTRLVKVPESPEKAAKSGKPGKPALADLLKKVRDKRVGGADDSSDDRTMPALAAPRLPRPEDDDLFDELADVVGASAKAKLSTGSKQGEDDDDQKTHNDPTLEVSLAASKRADERADGDDEALAPRAGIISRPKTEPRKRTADDSGEATMSATSRRAQKPEAAILGRIRTLKRPAADVLGRAEGEGEDTTREAPIAELRGDAGSGDLSGGPWDSAAGLPIGDDTPPPVDAGDDDGFVLADLHEESVVAMPDSAMLREEAVIAGVNEPSEAGISLAAVDEADVVEELDENAPPTPPTPPAPPSKASDDASGVIVDDTLRSPPPVPPAQAEQAADEEELSEPEQVTEQAAHAPAPEAAPKPAAAATQKQAVSPRPSRAGRGKLIAGLVLLVAGTAAVAAWASGALSTEDLPVELPSALTAAGGEESAAEDEAPGAPAAAVDDETIASVVGAARGVVGEAADAPTSTEGWLAMVGDDPAARSAMLEAAYAADPSTDTALALMNALLEADRPADARRVALSAKDEAEDPAPFEEGLRRSLEAQLAGANEPVVIDDGAGFTGLAGVEEQRRPGLRLTKADGSTWVFVPDRGEGEWRAEIALSRLCVLIGCHFTVPQTQPATLDRATYDGLLAAAPEEVQEAARKSFRDASWEDLEGRKAVWGAFRPAVDDHVPYPVEYTGSWRDWLNAGGAPEVLDAPLEDALAGLKDEAGGSFYEAIMTRRGEATTASLARQLTDVLLVDYLTNDWTRFQGAADRYGKKLRFADGELVSVDNSAAFQSRASTRVKGRFSWTTRFNRDVVEALRGLDRDATEAFLFPVKTRADGGRLSVFWDQRDRALKRIDGLVERHGEAAVYALER